MKRVSNLILTRISANLSQIPLILLEMKVNHLENDEANGLEGDKNTNKLKPNKMKMKESI